MFAREGEDVQMKHSSFTADTPITDPINLLDQRMRCPISVGRAGMRSVMVVSGVWPSRWLFRQSGERNSSAVRERGPYSLAPLSALY